MVILLTAMTDGLSVQRVQLLCQELGVHRRTLARWRSWWLNQFRQSPFWKGARAFFGQRLREEFMAWALCDAYKIQDAQGHLIALLKFLAPVTSSSGLNAQPG
jgi:hypothetical protein